MNGLSLAFLGDAYYELKIRQFLIKSNLTKVDILHKEKVKYTSSVAQCVIMDYLLENELLTQEEISYFKLGRNASHFGRKNVDGATYGKATGFESLIGYLSIHDESRCMEIINLGINYVKLGEING